VLTPISIVVALVLVFQGSIQNFSHYLGFNGISGIGGQIATGPVASQEAIKMLGTNGGGFFNVNSAHPFENPSGFTNFVEMLVVLVIPAALIAKLPPVSNIIEERVAPFSLPSPERTSGCTARATG